MQNGKRQGFKTSDFFRESKRPKKEACTLCMNTRNKVRVKNNEQFFSCVLMCVIDKEIVTLVGNVGEWVKKSLKVEF